MKRRKNRCPLPSKRKNSLTEGLLGLLFLFFSITGFAQDPPQFGEPFDGVPDPRDVNMYQVNIRAFSQASDLAGVTARLDNIADVGTNVIYLMPVFPVGEDARSIVSTSASPYTIKDFKGIGSEFGSLDDLRTLVEGAHDRGMAVILDFVVNQTSWDHPWITEHPDWYVRENGVIQQLREFSDVAALDFNNQEMRAAMIEAIRYWVFAANIDGFRMDFANNPPLDFWIQANGSLRDITSHDLLLFAEGDRLENFNVGFDLNFGDKWYYDALRPISQGASVNQIRTTTDIEYTNANERQQVVRYTGNHDTNGNGTSIEVFGGIDGVLANFAVSAYMRGVPFLYGGQEVAFPTRIPFPWDQVKINWNQNPDVTAEFKRILDFRTESNAIRRGTLSNFSNNDVVAFTKTDGDDQVLVLTNLRSGGASIELSNDITDASWTDAYTGEQIALNGSVSLDGFEYRAYVRGDGDGTGNTRPVADAGNDQILDADTASATLNGSGTDSDGDELTFSWSQTGGPDVEISDDTTAETSVSGLTNGNTYTFELSVSDGSLDATDTVDITVGQGTVDQSPFDGSPIAIPGTVEMEDYDNGGQGVSYNDNDTSNNGGEYRLDQGVDLEVCTEGGFNLGWTNPGEWTEYTVNVTTAGSYSADLRIASEIGGDLSISFDGQDVVSAVNIPNTGGWQNWQTVGSDTFTLNAGVQVMRVSYNGGGFNVNNIQIVNEGGTDPGTDPGNDSDIVRLKNRFLPDSYLYDNGDETAYGDVTGENAQWEQEIVEGYTLFKNVATGDYLNIENQLDFVESTSVDPSFWSAQWTLENYEGFTRLRNRWQNDRYIDNERQLGYVQATGGLFIGSYSTHWTLEPVASEAPQSGAGPTDGQTLESGVRLFPVPVADELNVSLPDEFERATVTVVDINGRQVARTVFRTGGSHQVDMGGLPKGLYVISVCNAGNSFSTTIVKE